MNAPQFWTKDPRWPLRVFPLDRLPRSPRTCLEAWWSVNSTRRLQTLWWTYRELHCLIFLRTRASTELPNTRCSKWAGWTSCRLRGRLQRRSWLHVECHDARLDSFTAGSTCWSPVKIPVLIQCVNCTSFHLLLHSNDTSVSRPQLPVSSQTFCQSSLVSHLILFLSTLRRDKLYLDVERWRRTVWIKAEIWKITMQYWGARCVDVSFISFFGQTRVLVPLLSIIHFHIPMSLGNMPSVFGIFQVKSAHLFWLC